MAREIVSEDLPRIQALLEHTLSDGAWCRVERMGGLTNRTYRVELDDGTAVVVRIPGEGTEELIVRRDEEVSTRLACAVGIDAPLLYFGPDGAKVSACIPSAVTMSAESMKEPVRIEQAAEILRRLHGCGEDSGIPFEVFDMAAGYEKIIGDLNVPMYEDYPAQKSAVMEVKARQDALRPPVRVPCHNDPLCENWVVGEGQMYLIDWEYAGMNDGMWDVADLSIEAGYGPVEDELLLRAYLGHDPGREEREHFLASKIYVDYLWTLWAKARVPYDGQPMEDWAAERYSRMKDNLADLRTVKNQT